MAARRQRVESQRLGGLDRDGVEGIVDAEPAADLLHLLDRIVVGRGVDGVGGAEGPGHLQLVVADVGGDDQARARQPRTLDRVEADAAATDHQHGRAGFDLGVAGHRTDAGRHAAADQRGLRPRHVLADRHHHLLRHHHFLGEGADARHLVDALALVLDAQGAVVERAGRHGGASNAQHGAALAAIRAAAAMGPEGEDHMVARLHRGDARPAFGDLARRLVARHDRHWRGPVAVHDVPIALADARSLHLDPHFAGLGRIELAVDNLQRLVGLEQNGGLHGISSPGWRALYSPKCFWEEAQMTRLNRRTILGGAIGALAAPAVNAQGSKPYAGTTINGSCFQTTYYEYLKNYFPQFEEKTGIKVNFTMQTFPVYNQRTDLELSTKGSAIDVCNVTFIYSGRWIGAGWFTNLDTFTKDAKYTPADWAPEDFAGGPQSAMRNAKGETFGYAWLAGAMILGASRYDLIEKAGLKLPTTFDELIKVCDAVHNKEGVAAFTADKLHHWNWIPYLMGMGGAVFKAPPDNLTPTLATPQAAQSAEWYANLLMKYGPDGILSYSDDQAMRSQMSGRANIRTQDTAWQVPLAKDPESTVQKTVRYGLMPAGPAGK